MEDKNRIKNFIQNLKDKYSKPKEPIMDIIHRGIGEYHKCVDEMSDQELYDHCFEDEYDPKYNNDYCIQVWNKRGLDQRDFIKN